MNILVLSGNLASDPELKTFGGDRSMAVFTIAINEGFGDKKKTYFINCVASGKTGEAIAKFFTKGQQILASGRLYTAKKDGETWKEVKVAIDRFEFCGPRQDATPKPDAANTSADVVVDGIDDFPFG